MTVKEVRENLSTYSDEDREGPLTALTKILSGVSMATLREFQNSWDGSKGFSEFRKAQDGKIAECIDLELSSTGKIVREELGLEPLLLTTVL